MSKNSGLMETSPGGEQTQYEGEHTDVDPPKKESGQLGGTNTSSTQQSSSKASNAPNTQGVTPAEKIRYGQAISEGGMGGKTTGGIGEATTQGGFGGTKSLDEKDDSFAKERREQGYGGENDADKHVGA
ncbi:hypothetical protein K504DRAFT_302605 [Pleomassaria siparia CBS 279.74]|uniref:Uncharacterized protein n=1 Tax=Pleomassaria siparia CBS 279.74 TaxID=1314801 RepID=A0A6G1K672_9PLEO|nr:hypothetical protein K504DRAFT_302605 [Pleomassaria siparia CBS 279.74]